MFSKDNTEWEKHLQIIYQTRESYLKYTRNLQVSDDYSQYQRDNEKMGKEMKYTNLQRIYTDGETV